MIHVKLDYYDTEAIDTAGKPMKIMTERYSCWRQVLRRQGIWALLYLRTT